QVWFAASLFVVPRGIRISRAGGRKRKRDVVPLAQRPRHEQFSDQRAINRSVVPTPLRRLRSHYPILPMGVTSLVFLNSDENQQTASVLSLPARPGRRDNEIPFGRRIGRESSAVGGSPVRGGWDRHRLLSSTFSEAVGVEGPACAPALGLE